MGRDQFPSAPYTVSGIPRICIGSQRQLLGVAPCCRRRLSICRRELPVAGGTGEPLSAVRAQGHRSLAGDCRRDSRGVCFRKWVMDYAERQGAGLIVQILASGMAFGFAHGVWGLLGRSARVALSATVATFVMGSALTVVYIASGRSLAPCIAAHMLITGLIEPGLVLAATMGQMERGR